MEKRPGLVYLIIALTFGIVGVSGLLSGRNEMLAFVVLAATFLIIGSNGDGKRASRRTRADR